MKYAKKMLMAVLSLMLISQSAMAFNPQATVSWSRLNRDPYNWSYTAKVYADRYDSTIKARIEANSYVMNFTNNKIVETDALKENSNSLVLGKALSSAYNTTWMDAYVVGNLSYGPDGLIPYRVEASKVNNEAFNPMLKTLTVKDAVALSELRMAVENRDQAMVHSFETPLEGYNEHNLFEYLMNEKNIDIIGNRIEMLDILNIQVGDSGLLLYESGNESEIYVYKQDCNGVNHEFKYRIEENGVKLDSHNITAVTTLDLNEQIMQLSQQLADC